MVLRVEWVGDESGGFRELEEGWRGGGGGRSFSANAVGSTYLRLLIQCDAHGRQRVSSEPHHLA